MCTILCDFTNLSYNAALVFGGDVPNFDMQKQKTDFVKMINFVGKLPLWILQTIATGLAGGFYRLLPSKTLRYARLNIQIALRDLPLQQQHHIARQAAINEAKSYFEFFHIWNNTTAQNLSLIHRVNGEHYFRTALERKKGVVLIVPHFGTWEVMNTWLNQFTQMTIMYKPIKNAAVDQFVLNAREQDCAHLVPTDESGVIQIFKALKKGGTTAILPDHSPDHPVDLENWFDVPVYSSRLSAKLIQKTGATGLIIYAVRNEQKGFDLTIEPISADIYDSSTNGTALIFAALEDLIRCHPEHYHWTYKRFRANPATSKLYELPLDEALSLIRPIQAQARESARK